MQTSLNASNIVMLMAAIRIRRRILLLICRAMVVGSLLYFVFPEIRAAQEPWCQINPTLSDNGKNDWVELPNRALHLVRASMQEEAKKSLSIASFKELTEKEARPYLHDTEAISQSQHLYLVRGAAFGVDDKYEMPTIVFGRPAFGVFFSPSRKRLDINSYALGGIGAPTNLVLIIEAPETIQGLDVSCLAAQ